MHHQAHSGWAVTNSEVSQEIHGSFSEFTEGEWNSLERGDFIFADLRFLLALERTGCLGRRTGWHPRIVAVRSAGELIGAMPLFDKSNSYGEYIFDWAWAQAAEASGVDYYPKSLSAIPFTPATGPKLLLSKSLRKAEVASRGLIDACLREANGKSSSHLLFVTETEAENLAASGYLLRHSFQFHWRNRGWKSFDEFLSALRSKRRKEIQRERSTVSLTDLKIERLTGDALNPAHAEVMYKFYRSTIEKMGGHPYLTRDFFAQIFSTMKDSILFVLASTANGEPVAGALNFFSGSTLFGRYWGCVEDYKQLHFEICYYQAIDWAIQNNISLFEAGAQGEHKFNRGFLPALTLSCHWVNDPYLREAIADFLEREKKSIASLFKDYQDHDPFQRT
jgi:predicted N-acyltransferase